MEKTRLQWLTYTAVFLLIVTAITIGLIASGIFDPSPFGSILWQQELQPMTIAPSTRRINWLDQQLPDTPFTIRLRAAYQLGEIDSGYGLVLGNEENYFTVAVSPLSYLAIWESSAEDSYYLNWQTWPHVREGNETNEIWLDIENDKARVRINREWLWEDEIELTSKNIGLIGESFGDEAVINFQTLEIFGESGP